MITAADHSTQFTAKRNRASAEMLAPTVLYSAEAEKAVLGCMMAQPAEVINDATVALSKDDFFVPAHQEIFRVLIEMSHAKSAIDVMTIHQWLTDRKLAETVGSPSILAELLVGFATHLNVGSYIRIVKDKSLLRCLQSACSTIVRDITEMPDSVPEVLDRAESVIFQVTNFGSTYTVASNAPALTAEFEAHLGAIDRGEKVAAIATGYHSLDRVNGGLKPAGMHVVGARPGMGKTTLLLNLAENLCQRGLGVGIISLEMDRIELMSSVYAFMGDVNSRRFKDKLSPEDWESVHWASQKISKWNLQVDDCALIDVNRMRHKARRMVRDGAGVILVDYLQLMQAPDDPRRLRNRAEDVAEMSRSIKLLAKELEVPIVVGCQLNRQAADGPPGLHMLRESGAVEQDADVIILLRLKDEKQVGPRITVIWNIAKWRGGEAGFDLEFDFDKTRQRFHENFPASQSRVSA